MEYTSDGDSEVEAYGAHIYALLVSGDLEVTSDEGLYHCPFCSDAVKDYNLHDLLQHALGVGAAHGQEAKKKAGHRALAKHLKGKPTPGSPSNPTPMDLQAPAHNKDKLFVWPWMGVLVNMPDDYIGKSANRLREHFSCFHPTKVHHVYSRGRPTGNAIIEFGKDWNGFRNLWSFESHFERKGYGKKSWKEMECGGTEPFGWMARADDYNSLGAVGDHLRKNGDLKTLNDIATEGAKKTKRLVANLECQVNTKKMHLEKLECENKMRALSLCDMMEKRDKLHHSYSQEILKLQQLHKQNTHKVVVENQELRMELQGMMHELDTRNKEIEELSAQSDHDKRNLELEKEKNALKANHLRLAELEQKKAGEAIRKLMEEQKRQEKATIEKFTRLRIQMETKQILELEIGRLMGQLQVMEITSSEDFGSTNKLGELRNELEEKISDLNEVESMNQYLIIKENKASDELREAGEVMIKYLQGLSGTTRDRTQIGIKKIGELDSKLFLNVCKRKFQEGDAEAESAILCSKWQNEINNPEWNPFIVVTVNGKQLEVLREDDEKLQELKQYGEEAYVAVTNALIELSNGDGSRRTPFPVLWNLEEGRKVRMKEAVQHALKLWKASKAKGKKRN